MKGREVGIMKGWKVGGIIGNHATTPSISTSKIRLKNEAKRKEARAGNASYRRRGSLRVSSPGCSGGGAGKGRNMSRLSLSFLPGLCIYLCLCSPDDQDFLRFSCIVVNSYSFL